MIPKILIDKLNIQYGKDLTLKILDGYVNRISTLRVNTSKITKENVLKILHDEKIKYEFVSWYEDALIIDDIDKLRTLDIYNSGCVYVQSLSSMIPPIVLQPSREKILDMAASPGGKTTQIYNLSNGTALITAVEKNSIRADRLKYNLNKQGCSATVLIEDAAKLDEFYSFDKILLDAPCSGSGTNHLDCFNEKLLKSCIETQKKLLDKAIQILKKGHIMVYSTCSILYEENEQQLERLLKKGIIEIIPIDDSLFKDIPKITTSIEGTLCVCPNALYEGFFIAKIRKK